MLALWLWPHSVSGMLQLRKMLDLLVHASQCRFPHCQYPNCRKVKGLFRHGIQCKTRASGGCLLCKKMWYLLQLHARACKESECHVPRCKWVDGYIFFFFFHILHNASILVAEITLNFPISGIWRNIWKGCSSNLIRDAELQWWRWWDSELQRLRGALTNLFVYSMFYRLHRK